MKTGALNSLMSFKLFKNSKAARRHLSKVYLNIHAVDKHLKPSYLWDSFNAEPDEVRSYIDELRLSGDVEEHLCVFVVMDTIFVAHPESLKNHLYELCVSNAACIVDVSEKRTPGVLSPAKTDAVLKSIYQNISRFLLNSSNNVWDQNCAQSNGPLKCGLEMCNMTTLFGVLLGYPVLYWYECQKSSDCYGSVNSLSMVPLRVYCVNAHVQQTDINGVSKRPIPTEHELFSFSIPEMLLEKTSKPIGDWYSNVRSRCNTKSLFSDVQMVHKNVVLPSVAM